MNIPYEVVVGAALGAFFGGIISWLLGFRFYRLSSRDLEQASDKLYLASLIILSDLEKQGRVKLIRDDAGNVTGFEDCAENIGAFLGTSSEDVEGLTKSLERVLTRRKK
jgi:hypothetical protein